MLVDMAIYLGHNTARRILESKLALNLEPVPQHSMVNCETGKKAVTGTIRAAFKDGNIVQPLAHNFFCHGDEPLDLMTDDPNARHVWKGGRTHLVPTKLPNGSFMQLKPGILVASPALCLLQLAPSLSLLKTIQLAMSFCGIYQLEGDDQRHPYERPPLTTPQEIAGYLSMVTKLHGYHTVRDALPWIIPNSGSQMETKMVLSLCLPENLGGYGLPKPEMNAKVALCAEMNEMLGQANCYGDAIWSVKGFDPFDMEYQSYEYHLSAEKYEADISRQLALQHEGCIVQFVTKHQLDDHNELNELARLVAEHTGVSLANSAFKWPESRVKRHDELMATF